MACPGNSISQLSLEISSICIPMISNDINKCYGMVIDSESIIFMHIVLVVLARNHRWH